VSTPRPQPDPTTYEQRTLDELDRAGTARDERYERYHLARAQVFATLAVRYHSERRIRPSPT
jgi:hypothetical protein